MAAPQYTTVSSLQSVTVWAQQWNSLFTVSVSVQPVTDGGHHSNVADQILVSHIFVEVKLMYVILSPTVWLSPYNVIVVQEHVIKRVNVVHYLHPSQSSKSLLFGSRDVNLLTCNNCNIVV